MGRARRAAAFATLVVVAIWSAVVSPAGVVRADPVPTLTVAPPTGLVDKQVVTVSGSGFAPGGQVEIRQCEGGATNLFYECNDINRAGDGSSDHVGDGRKTVVADAAGAFSIPMRVRREIATVHSLQFDCVAVPGACALVVVSPEAPRALLAFDPSAPAPARPSLSVSPTADLADGQLVTIDAGGFIVGELVDLYVCTTSSPVTIFCSFKWNVQADAAGSLHQVFAVSRVLQPKVFGGPPYDCAAGPDPCSLVVTAGVDPVRTSTAGLTFDPNAPPAATGLVVSPRAGLVDGQAVSITGQRQNGEQLIVAQCRSAPGLFEQSLCDPGTLVVSSADRDDGRVDVAVRVRGVIHLESGDFDCRTVVDACALKVGVGSPPRSEAFPLSFAGAAPAPGLAFTG